MKNVHVIWKNILMKLQRVASIKMKLPFLFLKINYYNKQFLTDLWIYLGADCVYNLSVLCDRLNILSLPAILLITAKGTANLCPMPRQHELGFFLFFLNSFLFFPLPWTKQNRGNEHRPVNLEGNKFGTN